MSRFFINILIFQFIFYVNLTLVKAQFSVYSNDFLNLSTNAQSAALGQSSYLLGNAVWAGIINPSGLLSDTGQIRIAATNQRLYSNLLNYNALSILYPQSNAGFSLSFIRSGVDNIQNTLQIIDSAGNFDFSKISYFSAADYALFASTARKFGQQGWIWGLSSKFLFRHYGNFAHAYGFGIDFSVFKKFEHFNFGIIYKDFGGTYTFWKIFKEEWEKLGVDSLLPDNFRKTEISQQKIIFAFSKDIMWQDYKIAAELDILTYFPVQTNVLVSTKYFGVSPTFGVEASYRNALFLRFGFNQIQKLQSLGQAEFLTLKSSLGFGLKIRDFGFDYAFSNIGNQHLLPSSHTFSIQVSFNQLGRKS